MSLNPPAFIYAPTHSLSWTGRQSALSARRPFRPSLAVGPRRLNVTCADSALELKTKDKTEKKDEKDKKDKKDKKYTVAEELEKLDKKIAKAEKKLAKAEKKLAEKKLEKTKLEKEGKKSKKPTETDPNVLLSAAELAEWAAVRAIVQSVQPGLDDAGADKVVSRAFGWGSQKWWRGDVVREPPNTEPVKTALRFLREDIGLGDDVIGDRIMKKFPEIIRLPVERMRENVAFMQRQYPALKGINMLRNSITEQPTALGFDVDCQGDCQSECARCWVRFE